FGDVADERQWVCAGRAIADELAREWPGPLTVRISGFESMLQYATSELTPYESPSDEQVRDIGGQCGVAEIGDIIARLDALARDKDALPDWDGDSQDDIARAQQLFARILAAAPARYTDDIRGGLDSPELQTREW